MYSNTELLIKSYKFNQNNNSIWLSYSALTNYAEYRWIKEKNKMHENVYYEIKPKSIDIVLNAFLGYFLAFWTLFFIPLTVYLAGKSYISFQTTVESFLSVSLLLFTYMMIPFDDYFVYRKHIVLFVILLIFAYAMLFVISLA
jgi:hypothetical protein